MSKKLSFVSLCLLLSIGLSAQVRYEVYAKGGGSNFIEVEDDYASPYVGVANYYYTALSSYGAGADVSIPLFDSAFHLGAFQVTAGCEVLSFAARNNIPKHAYTPSMGAQHWAERFNAISLPLEVGFKVRKWSQVQIHLHGGLVNTFQLSKPKEAWTMKMRRYTPNFTGGVDFLVKNRFVIGAAYCQNLKPLIKHTVSGSSYYVRQANIKIGYAF